MSGSLLAGEGEPGRQRDVLWLESCMRWSSRALVSKLVVYAQSAITVISGRDIFCYAQVNVKNVYALKLVCIYTYFKKQT